VANHPRTIAVDFDGVIHAYRQGWQDGSIYDDPHPGALDGLRTLMGHFAVFVHTSRNARQVAEWLADHGIETCVEGQIHAPMTFWNDRDRLLVTNRKLPAWRYVDDRALLFTSWGQTLRELMPDEARDARTERAKRALLEAWPDEVDGVFAEQAVQVMLDALEDRRG
jgi:hypothetical protein